MRTSIRRQLLGNLEAKVVAQELFCGQLGLQWMFLSQQSTDEFFKPRQVSINAGMYGQGDYRQR